MLCSLCRCSSNDVFFVCMHLCMLQSSDLTTIEWQLSRISMLCLFVHLVCSSWVCLTGECLFDLMLLFCLLPASDDVPPHCHEVPAPDSGHHQFAFWQKSAALGRVDLERFLSSFGALLRIRCKWKNPTSSKRCVHLSMRPWMLRPLLQPAFAMQPTSDQPRTLISLHLCVSCLRNLDSDSRPGTHSWKSTSRAIFSALRLRVHSLYQGDCEPPSFHNGSRVVPQNADVIPRMLTCYSQFVWKSVLFLSLNMLLSSSRGSLKVSVTFEAQTPDRDWPDWTDAWFNSLFFWGQCPALSCCIPWSRQWEAFYVMLLSLRWNDLLFSWLKACIFF